jgi:hypothetical protein
VDRTGWWAAIIAILLAGVMVSCCLLLGRGTHELAGAATPSLALATATVGATIAPSATSRPTVVAHTPPAAASPPTTLPTPAPSRAASTPSATTTPTRAPAARPVQSPTAIAPQELPVPLEELPTPPLLLKGDGPEVYLLVEGLRRHIVDMETFAHLGYRPEEILVSASLLSAYSDGPAITRLLQDADGPPSAGALYWLEDGIRHPIPDKGVLAALGLTEVEIAAAPHALILSFPLGQPLSAVRSEATPAPTAQALPAPGAERVVSTYAAIDGGPRLTELYTVWTDGSRPRRLTISNGNAYSLSPAWSPDGRSIAYTHCPDGSSGTCAITVIPSEGGEALALAEPMTDGPAWSPDGQQITYWSSRTLHLYVMDADGGNVRDLGAGRGPAWTPGGQIAFWAGEGEPTILSVVDVASAEAEPVDGRIGVYDQRYHPWRTVEWVSTGDPWSPAGP